MYVTCIKQLKMLNKDIFFCFVMHINCCDVFGVFTSSWRPLEIEALFARLSTFIKDNDDDDDDDVQLC